ncbi:hypothetical protein [Nocardia asteroides]|uniref:Integral membrane protein n=1 Tax=Nocardia asteroides NBRC 15531 TaxID=1110697 RepID=U5E4Y2_NOCAS|nr:hypothetical protein [Nocardia asteroides]TLF62280.1 hypothetical protein FEK33_30240 [Nocardia asteroides NBRC 15531]UGT48114.1 hypothetical protein LT345_27140 [Nocardia asteroides]SFN69030.1 hypothetical protein SAMN05444423_1124 [Nocardia asteroides]VEG32942.1 Uncharacterised protein [Nocardia asteroides]GAD84592.1 hypothetical protein NCAST_25_00120 [Nocardia asteroides NBRC 15531]
MTRFLALLAGLLLVAAVALINPFGGVAALALVVLSWWWRPAAVGAVLVAIAAIAFADIGVVAAAAAGLVATTYLLNAAVLHAPEGVVPTTIPSVGGAVLFSIAAATAALVPVELVWAPLAAPVLIMLIYALLVGGLAGNGKRVEPEVPAA